MTQFRDVYEQARSYLVNTFKRDGVHFMTALKRQGVTIPPAHGGGREGFDMEAAAKMLARHWLFSRSRDTSRDEAAIADFIARKGVTVCPPAFLNPTSVTKLPQGRHDLRNHIERVEIEPDRQFHAEASVRRNRARRGWRAQLNKDKKGAAAREQRLLAAE